MVENKYYESDDDDDSHDDDDFSLNIQENDSDATTNDTCRDQSNDVEFEQLLEVGDHVFKWCSHELTGVRYQHHGIVFKVHTTRGEDEGEDRRAIEILDFYLDENSEESSARQNSSVFDIGRSCAGGSISGPGRLNNLVLTDPTEINEWQKNPYENNGTAPACDPKEVVIVRAKLLLSNPSILPPYHALKSNCECVAVWCKTGKWCTRQGRSVLEKVTTFTRTGAIAGYTAASTVTATVPASGLWGFLGFTTEVSALAAFPALIPGIGIIGLGAAATLYKQRECEQFWEQTSETLNREFCTFLVRRSMQEQNVNDNMIT